MGHWATTLVSIFFWVCFAYIIFVFCCRRKRNNGIVFTTVQAVPAQSTLASEHVYPYNTVMSAPAIIGHVAPYPVQSAPIVAPCLPCTTNYTPYSQQLSVAYPVENMLMPQPYNSPSVPFCTSDYPPAYDQAVKNESYQKQAPYNPNYTGN